MRGVGLGVATGADCGMRDVPAGIVRCGAPCETATAGVVVGAEKNSSSMSFCDCGPLPSVFSGDLPTLKNASRSADCLAGAPDGAAGRTPAAAPGVDGTVSMNGSGLRASGRAGAGVEIGPPNAASTSAESGGRLGAAPLPGPAATDPDARRGDA